MKRGFLGLLAMLTLGIAAPVNAAPYVADAVDRGWYGSDGLHTSSNKNTYTGFIDTLGNPRGPHQDNSFFIFDLTGFGGGASSALLELELENYFGIDFAETFTVYDVSTSAAALSLDYTDAFGIYNDLMTGSVYGSATVSATDVGSIIQVALNSQALADINSSAGGQFAIGLALTSLFDSNNYYPDYHEGVRFSMNTEPRTHRLTIDAAPVPEPSTLLLFASGLAGLGWMGLRRKK